MHHASRSLLTNARNWLAFMTLRSAPQCSVGDSPVLGRNQHDACREVPAHDGAFRRQMSRRSGPGISPARNGSKWIRPRKRRAIYARDGFQCLYCESAHRLTLDHVRGHSNCPTNLITCCLSCNSAKCNRSPRSWYALLRKRLGISVLETRKIRCKIFRQRKKPLCLET